MINASRAVKLFLAHIPTHQHINHMQVHGDDVGHGADEVLLHTVEDQYSEVGAQTQNDLQQQEACQRSLSTERHWRI